MIAGFSTVQHPNQVLFLLHLIQISILVVQRFSHFYLSNSIKDKTDSSTVSNFKEMRVMRPILSTKAQVDLIIFSHSRLVAYGTPRYPIIQNSESQLMNSNQLVLNWLSPLNLKGIEYKEFDRIRPKFGQTRPTLMYFLMTLAS